MALSAEEKQRINPGLAAVFSFLFSGLGQIYNGQIWKGLAIMSISAIAMVFVIIGFVRVGLCLLSNMSEKCDLLLGSFIVIAGVALIAVLGVYNIHDAYYTAKRKLEE